MYILQTCWKPRAAGASLKNDISVIYLTAQLKYQSYKHSASVCQQLLPWKQPNLQKESKCP